MPSSSSRKDLIHFAAGSTYAEYIAVAIEHANLPNGTPVEINKLQLFNTPLKVLITYAGGTVADTLLEKYARMIGRADVFADFSTHRKQLVIFGPPGNRTPDSLKWRYYVYNGSAFVDIS